MKKLNLVLSSLAVATLIFGLGKIPHSSDKVSAEGAAVTPRYGGGEVAVPNYANLPEQGDHDESSYLEVIVEDKTAFYGVKRVSDRSILVNQNAAWGVRAELDRLYDASDFEVSFDLGNIGEGSKSCLMFGFAVGSKGYPSTGNYLMNFDIIHSQTDLSLWRVCVGNNANVVTNDHAGHYIEGFCSEEVWADDSAFIGRDIHITDNTLTIRMEMKTTGSAKYSLLTINGEEFQMEYDDIYRNFPEGEFEQTVYFSGMNTTALSYQINYVADKYDADYFDETNGQYFVTKKMIETLEDNLETKLSKADTAIEVAGDFIEEEDHRYLLRKGDKAYLGERASEIEEAIDLACEDPTIGEDIKLGIYDIRLERAETAAEIIVSLDDLTFVSDLIKIAEDVKESIGEVSEGNKDKFVALNNRLVAVKNKLADAVKNKFMTAITEFEKSIDQINSLDSFKKVYDAKEAFNTDLLEFLSESDREQMQKAYDAAIAKYEKKITFEAQALTTGGASKAVYCNDQLNCIFDGTSAYGDVENSCAFYSKEKLNAKEFTCTFNIKSIDTLTTFALGIMEKPDTYSVAQDPSCTDNLGIFFTIQAKNSTTASVMKNIMNLQCTRFYDAQLNSMTSIDIPLNTDVTFKITEYEKEIAGLRDTYVRYSFNDVNFDEIHTTKSRDLKQLYGSSCTGYFIFAQESGYKTLVEMKSINGHKFTDSTFVNETPKPVAPSFTAASYEVIKGNDAALGLNLNGQTLTTVKVDNVVVAAEMYSFENNILTFKKDYISSLSVADHTVLIATAGGEATAKLIVKEEAKKGGCGGEIIGSSIAVFAISLFGLAVFTKKRKEK